MNGALAVLNLGLERSPEGTLSRNGEVLKAELLELLQMMNFDI